MEHLHELEVLRQPVESALAAGVGMVHQHGQTSRAVAGP